MMEARTLAVWTKRLALLAIVAVTLVAFNAFTARPAYAAQGDSAYAHVAGATPLTPQYYNYTTTNSAPTAIPSNNASRYEVYSTYLFFTIGVDSNMINYNMYMDIKRKGKKEKWQTFYFDGYMKTYTIKGLDSNTNYVARLYYGLNSTVKGPYSKTITFKTGPKKKPAVKSIKVQTTNLRKHYQKIYGYYTGVYMGKRPYYTYKIRTTVTLKKKPKQKYIMINNKKFKANKKQYTVTTKKLVKYYSTPRGDKYTVSVCTYHKKSWKGYSLLYQKTFKAR